MEGERRERSEKEKRRRTRVMRRDGVVPYVRARPAWNGASSWPLQKREKTEKESRREKEREREMREKERPKVAGWMA